MDDKLAAYRRKKQQQQQHQAPPSTNVMNKEDVEEIKTEGGEITPLQKLLLGGGGGGGARGASEESSYHIPTETLRSSSAALSSTTTTTTTDQQHGEPQQCRRRSSSVAGTKLECSPPDPHLELVDDERLQQKQQQHQRFLITIFYLEESDRGVIMQQHYEVFAEIIMLFNSTLVRIASSHTRRYNSVLSRCTAAEGELRGQKTLVKFLKDKEDNGIAAQEDQLAALQTQLDTQQVQHKEMTEKLNQGHRVLVDNIGRSYENEISALRHHIELLKREVSGHRGERQRIEEAVRECSEPLPASGRKKEQRTKLMFTTELDADVLGSSSPQQQQQGSSTTTVVGDSPVPVEPAITKTTGRSEEKGTKEEEPLKGEEQKKTKMGSKSEGGSPGPTSILESSPPRSANGHVQPRVDRKLLTSDEDGNDNKNAESVERVSGNHQQKQQPVTMEKQKDGHFAVNAHEHNNDAALDGSGQSGGGISSTTTLLRKKGKPTLLPHPTRRGNVRVFNHGRSSWKTLFTHLDQFGKVRVASSLESLASATTSHVNAFKLLFDCRFVVSVAVVLDNNIGPHSSLGTAKTQQESQPQQHYRSVSSATATSSQRSLSVVATSSSVSSPSSAVSSAAVASSGIPGKHRLVVQYFSVEDCEVGCWGGEKDDGYDDEDTHLGGNSSSGSGAAPALAKSYTFPTEALQTVELGFADRNERLIWLEALRLAVRCTNDPEYHQRVVSQQISRYEAATLKARHRNEKVEEALAAYGLGGKKGGPTAALADEQGSRSISPTRGGKDSLSPHRQRSRPPMCFSAQQSPSTVVRTSCTKKKVLAADDTHCSSRPATTTATVAADPSWVSRKSEHHLRLREVQKIKSQLE